MILEAEADIEVVGEADNGVEATRRIVALDEYVYDALHAGASGFLLKDTPPEDLVRAVHVVAAAGRSGRADRA